MRNLAGFLIGVLFVVLVAVVPEYASAAELTAEEYALQMAVLSEETNSIITQSVYGLAWCLGAVAGSFR